VQARNLPLPAETEAQLDDLEQQRERLQQQIEETDEEEYYALYEQLEAVEQSIEAIQRNRPRQYAKRTKAYCGVLVGIRSNGELGLIYGLVRKEDRPEFGPTAPTDDESDDASATLETPRQPEGDANESRTYSSALLLDLSQHKTAAIAAELTKQPEIALATVVYTLVLNHFGLDLHVYGSHSSVQLSSKAAHLEGAEDARACIELNTQRQDWLAQFPKNATELWQWCITRTQDTLLALLAFCTALAVDGVEANKDSSHKSRLNHADQLANALRMDMGNWFTPTADNFFKRVSKAQIARALTEAGKPLRPEGFKNKKEELAAIAEKEVRGTGWLPEPVRIDATPGTGKGENG
jgi:ParB family chromosome partitioning protein